MEAGALARMTALAVGAGAAYAFVVLRASAEWLVESSSLKPLGAIWLGYLGKEAVMAAAAAVLAFAALRVLEVRECSAPSSR